MEWPLLLKENINSRLPEGEKISKSREETGMKRTMALGFNVAF